MIVGLVSLSQTSASWQLYVFFGLLVGVGYAFTWFVPCTTVAINWFIKKRPLALSIVISSAGIAGLAIAPILAYLISSTTWRISWLFLAAIILVLNLGVAGTFVRNRPEDVGQQPDGASGQTSEAGSPEIESSQTGQWSVGTAMRSLPIWQIVILSVAFMFALQTMLGHQVAYLKDIGYSPTVAATTLGLLPGMSIAGRFSYSFLARRFKPEHIAVGLLGGMLVAVLLFMFMSASSLVCIYVYTVLFGFGYGATLVARTDMIAVYYGRKIFPQLQGWVFPFQSVAALGPWVAGTIHDTTDSYHLAFIIVLIVLGVGLLSTVFLRPPK